MFELIPDTEYPGCPEAIACNVDWFVAKGLIGGVFPSYAVKLDPACWSLSLSPIIILFINIKYYCILKLFLADSTPCVFGLAPVVASITFLPSIDTFTGREAKAIIALLNSAISLDELLPLDT